MSNDRYIITGASGQLGQLVARRVLVTLPPERLILVTRRPEALSTLRAGGCEVRFADFDQPGGLSAAFADARRMLLISTTDVPRRIEQHHAALDAARSAGVEHVAYTSMISPDPPNPAVIAPSHYATERWLAQSELSWTLLRNNLYAEYQVSEAARAIATGSFVHNRGDGRIAYVAREDCAAVAAAVLTSDARECTVYEVTGPHSYDASALAVLYGDLAGRSVEAVAVDDEAFVKGIFGTNAADEHARFGAELVTSLGRATREGYFDRCTVAVETLTGRPARSLRQVLEAGLKPS